MGLLFLGRRREGPRADARLAAAQEGDTRELAPSLEIEAEIARAVPSAEIVELAGRLEPVRSTWVSAEMAGRIVSVPATEHAPVAQGEVLVQLDSALPRAELIRAEASHRLAKSELERQQRLGKRSVASEAELELVAVFEESAVEVETSGAQPVSGFVGQCAVHQAATVVVGQRKSVNSGRSTLTS